MVAQSAALTAACPLMPRLASPWRCITNDGTPALRPQMVSPTTETRACREMPLPRALGRLRTGTVPRSGATGKVFNTHWGRGAIATSPIPLFLTARSNQARRPRVIDSARRVQRWQAAARCVGSVVLLPTRRLSKSSTQLVPQLRCLDRFLSIPRRIQASFQLTHSSALSSVLQTIRNRLQRPSTLCLRCRGNCTQGGRDGRQITSL